MLHGYLESVLASHTWSEVSESHALHSTGGGGLNIHTSTNSSSLKTCPTSPAVLTLFGLLSLAGDSHHSGTP